MAKTKIRLKYKKEKVVLSETLPYELPVTFSNRYFYEFLITHEIEYLDGFFYWRKNTEYSIDKVILILLGLPKDTNIENCRHPISEKPNYRRTNKLKSPGNIAGIPFVFSISHQEKQYRDLAILHPRNQIRAVEFYQRYKELILYYGNKSKFSLRAPSRVSDSFYFQPKSRMITFEESSSVEEVSGEYKSLKSFFVYKTVSNIFKFYESDEYHRCEKQYNRLCKLDISKCFDSIYTHSISWAINSKEAVKEVLSTRGGPRVLDKTFSGQFDRLMQQANYHETNGILIGPELSRIFAELILQEIDVELENKLKVEHKVTHRQNYEIFRYVDDYFL